MLDAIKQFIFVFRSITQCQLGVKDFQGKTSTLSGPEHICHSPKRNTKRARLVAFDKIRNVFSLTYAQMIAKELRQLNIYCHHMHFMKTGHEFNCSVII